MSVVIPPVVVEGLCELDGGPALLAGREGPRPDKKVEARFGPCDELPRGPRRGYIMIGY